MGGAQGDTYGCGEAKLQTLKGDFELIRMKERESVDDFAMKLTTIVNGIRALGEKVEDSIIVRKFLRVVPSRILQIASSIEQFGDLKTMTIEELLGRLRAHEKRIRGSGDKEGEQLG